MLLKNRLFTPGPTPLLPAAQNAMAAFTAHHRTADFKALFTRVLDEIGAKLTPETRVVYVQATESSTGARHDVKGIAKLVRQKGDNTLLVVDAITGLGTTHLHVDDWGIDVIIGGSQKALMIPPGLAYCAISERAWKRMETAKSPRYYFDLRKERKSAAKGESAYTPATALFAALA